MISYNCRVQSTDYRCKCWIMEDENMNFIEDFIPLWKSQTASKDSSFPCLEFQHEKFSLRNQTNLLDSNASRELRES